MQPILYKEKAEYHLMLLAKMYFFPSKNENLFKNLNSLNFRSVPFI